MQEELTPYHSESLQVEAINERQMEILKCILLSKENILVVGEKGSGKTSLINLLLKNLPSNETLLIFDYYNEIKRNNYPGKSFLVGYGESSDIIGNQTYINPHTEMVSKALLLPFDRVVADELYTKELNNVFKSLYGSRSGIFSIAFNNPENALKHLFYETMYPQNKQLTKEFNEKACKLFKYAITVQNNILIQELTIENGNLALCNLC